MTPSPAAENMAQLDFERIARDEAANWWFVAKRRLAIQELRRLGPLTGAVVDVGCGVGGTADPLRAAGFDQWVGVEPNPHGLGLARARRPGLPLVAGVAEALPMPDASQDCLVSLDVIEHLDDDVAGLVEYRRALRPGGRLVVAVPAYQWAWSEHDVRLGHRRRYTRASLRAALDAAGFEVTRVTHFHTWLVPVAAAIRKTPLRRWAAAGGSEARSVPPGIDRLLHVVCSIERFAARLVPLPFGLSVLAVAVAPPPRG